MYMHMYIITFFWFSLDISINIGQLCGGVQGSLWGYIGFFCGVYRALCGSHRAFLWGSIGLFCGCTNGSFVWIHRAFLWGLCVALLRRYRAYLLEI